MPIAKFQMPDGRVARFEVPEGTTPEQAGQMIEQYIGSNPDDLNAPVKDDRSMWDKVKGFAQGVDDNFNTLNESAATMITGAIAEPIAGLAGIAAQVMPGGKTGGDMVEATRNALTYIPRSKRSQEALGSMADALSPVTDAIEGVEKASGDFGYDLAGPIGGAIGTTAPTAAIEALGLGAMRRGAQGTKAIKNIVDAKPDAESAALLEAGKKHDVPILNTDMNQPNTFVGRVMQSFSEKMGPLGSGTARASQQAARQKAVESLAKEFNAELSSPFAEKMVQSLKAKHAKDIAEASDMRAAAVDTLDQFGEVPTTKTLQAIDRQIAIQERLGARGNKSLVQNLTNTREAMKNGNFSLIKDVRSEVIKDVEALARSEDRRAMGAIQSVKKAMDDDLLTFARANDRNAAANWVKSNRKYAEAYASARNSELKRVLNSGDVTPERVLPILRGGKPSELRRLKEGLTADGLKNAKAAIIRDVLDESGFFRGDVNPDRVATSLSRSNRMKAINTFFEGRELKEINGFRRLLEATRRAQQSSVAPATGIQNMPLISGGLGAAGASVVGAIPTIATVGTLSGIAKAYESRPFRNLMLKIGNRKKGSLEEKRLLDAATTALLAELQAARAQQQQTEETRQQ